MTADPPETTVAPAGDESRSRDRMRELLRLNNDLTRNLDLDTVLQRIAEISVELVDARYGAIGVLGEENQLSGLIHVGLPPQVAERMAAHPPEGKGLIGLLIDDPRPVRIARLKDDPRSIGFPAHHPGMESFLGVPIRVRDRVFGNIYLTNSRNGAFSADDEELAQALAATAGIAIENARLFDDATFRTRWSTALAEVSRGLMAEGDGDVIGPFLARLGQVADADLVSVVTTVDDIELLVDHAAGSFDDDLPGTAFPLDDSLAEKPLRTGSTSLVTVDRRRGTSGFDSACVLGTAVLAPFHTDEGRSGVLCVARIDGSHPFTPRDVEMVEAFAGHASVALERAESRSARRRMAVLEDRARIARDLHDNVIQRLFAVGLSLQAAVTSADVRTAERVMDQVREIDTSIATIRRTIFAMKPDADSTASQLRARILEIVDHAGQSLTNKPRVSFLGPIDLISDAALGDDIAAVVSETVTNAVRHASADRIHVTVSAISGRATVEVVDDGIGMGTVSRRSGLENLRVRAEARAGGLEIREAAGGGTHVTWSVPV